MIKHLLIASFLLFKIAEATDAEVIFQARRAQNKALAAFDIDAAATLWTEDITVRRGLGDSVLGKEAYTNLFRNSKIVFTREPEIIEVSPDWPLAFEAGHWIAHQGETRIMGGKYSAHWIKVQDNWLIRSELFVSLNRYPIDNN